jgi:predicted nucleic acid-binding protein
MGPAGEAAFLAAVAAGELELVELMNEDLRRMVELVEMYANFPLGAVDASVIAVAGRHKCSTMATLDLRHFAAVRPLHVESFDLLPD